MQHKKLTGEALLWALQGACALHRKPFSIELAQQKIVEFKDLPPSMISITQLNEHYLGYITRIPHQTQPTI